MKTYSFWKRLYQPVCGNSRGKDVVEEEDEEASVW